MMRSYGCMPNDRLLLSTSSVAGLIEILRGVTGKKSLANFFVFFGLFQPDIVATFQAGNRQAGHLRCRKPRFAP